jgi:uncharacterized alpha-E superfamily protein
MDVYRAGNINLSNAIGTGIADDKSIYPYVPKMIEFYLGEKPILNNVPTYLCRESEDLKYVLAHLSELVVKEVHGAGGYGMLVGPAATKAEIEDFRRVLLARPGNYIAQPTLALSSCPTFVESGIAPRHIDLRPFVLSGKHVQMVPGGLDACGAQGRFAGGEFVARRGHQGHLGAGRLKGKTIMLSRTADHLFWMARYMERAENTARMLDVNYQTALLPQSTHMSKQGWSGLLSISELTGSFSEKYREVNARSVMEFMVRDETNLSSIVACLRAARENARAVRGALTTEVWETQNQTWLEFNRMLKEDAFERDPGSFFEWVKFRSHLSRGVTVGTMLQDEALYFLRIGTFLERADNTARLLDVKFQALAGGDYFGPDTGKEDPEVDFYHWSAILRSVSAFEIYRKVYRNVIQPEKVAELLILRPDMPRSLAACMNEAVANLQLVANEQSSETLRRGGRLKADLRYGRIDEILATGLHAYLTPGGLRADCRAGAAGGTRQGFGLRRSPLRVDCAAARARGPVLRQAQTVLRTVCVRAQCIRPRRPRGNSLRSLRSLSLRHSPGVLMSRRAARAPPGSSASRRLRLTLGGYRPPRQPPPVACHSGHATPAGAKPAGGRPAARM